MAGLKRSAEVPPMVKNLDELVSKADLLEAAWWLAVQVHGEEGDEIGCLTVLVRELQLHREHRGARMLRVPPARLKSNQALGLTPTVRDVLRVASWRDLARAIEEAQKLEDFGEETPPA